MRRQAIRRGALLLALALVAAALLLAPAVAGRATPRVGSALHGSMAPVNPAFLESLVRAPIGAPSGADVGQPLGGRPGPQDFSHTAGMQVPGVSARSLPATYDLRPLGRVTSVKDQNPYGTCWAFASLGSLESCLLTPEQTWDFSEDNMVLNSGFNYPGGLYDGGGTIYMSTAYLARWRGPVYESEDAYGDNYTPLRLTARKHVQEVKWIPPRGSALDNANIKTAVMQYGAADVSMCWNGSTLGSAYYNATTASYYYSAPEGTKTNHEVLIVGWDDNYAAANFATIPRGGNGAFLVKNSWGSAWGSNGYFYVSYYDSTFGRKGPMAVFSNAESTSNYSGIYQYDPLGYCAKWGFGSTTGWLANVFTAQASASLSAVGFYTVVPGTSYEVYTGSSLATKTLRTSGTLAYMGYHTVALPAPVAVTNGQPFVVAMKVTTPGDDSPIALENPFPDYSSGATASAGQSYVSSNGSSWTDITTIYSNTNVCLKAYVKASPAPPITVTAPTAASSWPSGSTQTVAWTVNPARTGGEFRVWLVSAAGGWYINKQVLPTSGKTSYSTAITASVPGAAGYKAYVYWRPVVGSGTWTATARSAAFTVTPINITSPTAASSWPSGSTQTVAWTVNPARTGGEFRVWLVSAAGAWYVNKQVLPTAGKSSYSTAVKVSCPAAAGYKAYVYWRSAVGTGTWTATARSAAFTVTPINITAPTAASLWKVNSMQSVTWTVNPARSSGEFRVWLVSAAGAWYVNKQVLPTAGKTAYAASIKVSVPAAAGYKAYVYWRSAVGTGTWTATARSAAFRVTP